jgi:hypothetical protein
LDGWGNGSDEGYRFERTLHARLANRAAAIEVVANLTALRVFANLEGV